MGRTNHEDLLALKKLGGVGGLAKSLYTNIRFGLPYITDNARDGIRVPHFTGSDSQVIEYPALGNKDVALLEARSIVFGNNVLPQRPPSRKSSILF